MKKEFVPFEEALTLQALGFDDPCFAFYYKKAELTMVDDDYQYNHTGFRTCKNSEIPISYISAPTFSQAFRWFREKYNISCTIDWMTRVEGYYSGYIVHFRGINSHKLNEENLFVLNSESSEGYAVYKTYEEAELACLNKLIEIVKTKTE